MGFRVTIFCSNKRMPYRRPSIAFYQQERAYGSIVHVESTYNPYRMQVSGRVRISRTKISDFSLYRPTSRSQDALPSNGIPTPAWVHHLALIHRRLGHCTDHGDTS